MDKKTILAVFLMLAVFWISNEFIWKPKAEARIAAEKAQAQAEDISKKISTTEEKQKVDDHVNIPDQITNSDIEINNNIKLITKHDKDNLIYKFTNLGGLLTDVILSDYFTKDKETKSLTSVDLIPENGSIFNIVLNQSNGEKLDLSKVVFETELSSDNNKLTFTYNTENGFIRKTYQLSDLPYTLNMDIEMKGFTAVDSYQIQMDKGISDTENYLKMKSRDYQVDFQLNNEYNKFTLASLKSLKEINTKSKLQEKFILKGKIDWAAIRSKYFIQAIIPERRIEMEAIEAFKTIDTPAANLEVNVDKDEFHHSYQLYIGPLIGENLQQFSNGIENCVETGPGFLKWLSKIFLWAFLFIHKLVPSWGLAVIIFAILLKSVLYPLTHKSFESTSKMQKINPLMKEIQTKYKNDPKKMNDELRALYKEHGVNPMGGCLPMLLQMPILFAIYPIFRYSINLRQSNFLWLPDLSEPDPLYLLPIAMALFMFIQQKLMAPSYDNVEEMTEQQKASMQSQRMMMYMMPLMMLFFFKSLSSGLVLYWTVFSIIGTIQQVFIKRKFQ